MSNGKAFSLREREIIRQAPSAVAAQHRLAYRSRSGVLKAWHRYHPWEAGGPVTPDEHRLATLLLQMRRITRREQTHIDGSTLLATLRDVWKVWE